MKEVKHKTKHMRHEMIKKEELTHTYVHVRNTHTEKTKGNITECEDMPNGET